MSIIKPDSVTVVQPTRSLREQFSIENAKKAYVAGVGGAIGAAGTVSVASVLADGKIDSGELIAVGGALLVGFVTAFLGAWLPSQPASAPTE